MPRTLPRVHRVPDSRSDTVANGPHVQPNHVTDCSTNTTVRVLSARRAPVPDVFFLPWVQRVCQASMSPDVRYVHARAHSRSNRSNNASDCCANKSANCYSRANRRTHGIPYRRAYGRANRCTHASAN